MKDSGTEYVVYRVRGLDVAEYGFAGQFFFLRERYK